MAMVMTMPVMMTLVTMLQMVTMMPMMMWRKRRRKSALMMTMETETVENTVLICADCSDVVG